MYVNDIYALKSQKISLWKYQRNSVFKGAMSSLRRFLAIESPLEMMKNAIYFTTKALFVLKVFNFLSLFFGDVAKRLY